MSRTWKAEEEGHTGDETSGFAGDGGERADRHVDRVIVIAGWAGICDRCCYALAVVGVDDFDLLAAKC